MVERKNGKRKCTGRKEREEGYRKERVGRRVRDGKRAKCTGGKRERKSVQERKEREGKGKEKRKKKKGKRKRKK